jgi:tetratricopeptide (TPR) repeat protein
MRLSEALSQAFSARAFLGAVLIWFAMAYTVRPANAAAAQGQPLPAAAQEAIEEGRAAMREALATYQAQYPDRPLWQEAFRHGRTARGLAPDQPEPLRFLAEAYSRANWYGPAWNAWLEYLEQGNPLDAEATPLFTEVGSQIGYNYYRQGRPDDATMVYRRIIDEVPFDLEAHTWMGRLLLETGKPEQAISYWQTVVDRNPEDDRAEYFLELAREQARWGSEAVNAFREGVRFYEEGALEKARERFARATSLNADYAEAWAWLGRVNFDRGDYRDARTFYGRASELAPGNETYGYFLEESRRRAESQREAAAGSRREGQSDSAARPARERPEQPESSGPEGNGSGRERGEDRGTP